MKQIKISYLDLLHSNTRQFPQHAYSIVAFIVNVHAI